MSVSVTVGDLKRIRDLLTLYKAKDAFEFSEAGEVATVYKDVSEALKEAGDDDEHKVDLDKNHVAYVVQAMHVCAMRKPMELQNYAVIYKLFVTLTETLKSCEEETKDSA